MPTNDSIVIKIWYEQGNRARQQLAVELKKIFTNGGFTVAEMWGGQSGWSGVPPDMLINLNTSDESIANAIFLAFKDRLFRFRPKGSLSDKNKKGIIEIQLIGDPLFNPDGSIYFK